MHDAENIEFKFSRFEDTLRVNSVLALEKLSNT